jgi:hypothetical protein
MDEEAVTTGILRKSEFSLTDITSGFRVDFWPLKTGAFDASCFRRRVPEQIFGQLALVSAPEDTILNKLRWAKQLGGSEKQFNDALQVYELQHKAMEHGYLLKWAEELGLLEELNQLRAKARPVKQDQLE